MTFQLQTENYGIIDAGYFSIFTQEVRMGNFSIRTPEFCNFVSRLAAGETAIKTSTVEDYDVEGSWVPARNIVKLGKYEIAGKEFGVFADYVFNGGFLGWRQDQQDWKPDFVHSAINYVTETLQKTRVAKDSYLYKVKQKHFESLEELI